MIRRPPRSTRVRSSAASDVYKRQLVALLENHQQEDGSLYLPPPLRPYFSGQEYLHPES